MNTLNPKLGIDIPYKPKKTLHPSIQYIVHDKIRFYTVKFHVPGILKGKILILHGWCEHATMYYRIMEYLADLGYECFIFDQRGAGRTSLGKYRGRCGRSLDTVLADTDKMIETFWVDDKLENSKELYLLGHLAGGAIALDYMINGKYRAKLAGVMTTGPMIKVAEPLTPSPFIEYLLNVIATWFPYTPWGSINRDPSVRSSITTAEEWLEYLQNELLTQGNCTLGQIKSIFDRGYKLANVSAQEMTEKLTSSSNIKLLIIHCANDTITSFKQLKSFFEKIPLSNKQFIAIERGNHSLFIETDEIFNEACTALEQFLRS